MHYLKAFFLRRLNRFLIECKIEGKRMKAYLPNPGRLWELLLPGREIYITEREGKGLPYTVLAVKRGDTIISLNTHYTNIVASRLLSSGMIEGFKDYQIISREISLAGHRIDFLLGNNSRIMPLEVKSCTLYGDSIAMFPDAVTLRGRRHLEVLAQQEGGILFIVHSPQVSFFLPDFHTDPDFSETLYKLRGRLRIKAVSIKWDEDLNFHFCKELSIPWHVYEREGKDRGSYLITGFLKDERYINVGGLGRLRFRRGHYIYIGSAMNNLKARIKRHLKKQKRQRWHIDYLIPYLEGIKAVPIRSSEDLECRLSDSISSISDEYIKDFGSSDCKCPAHLYFIKRDPFQDEGFIEILLKYRIGRLKDLVEF